MAPQMPTAQYEAEVNFDTVKSYGSTTAQKIATIQLALGLAIDIVA